VRSIEGAVFDILANFREENIKVGKPAALDALVQQRVWVQSKWRTRITGLVPTRLNEKINA